MRCPTPDDICAEMAVGSLGYPLPSISPNYPKPEEGPEMLSQCRAQRSVPRVAAGSANVGIMLCFGVSSPVVPFGECCQGPQQC